MLGALPLESDGKRDLARLGIQIVHEQHPIVAPVIPHHKHRGIVARDHREIAPAHLGDFLAHADNPFSPVQERIGMTPLDRGVDVETVLRSFVREIVGHSVLSDLTFNAIVRVRVPY